MRHHLDRIKICKPILQDINPKDFNKEILNEEKNNDTVKNNELLHSAPNCSILLQNEKFECQFCDKNYKYNRNLNKHLHPWKFKTEQKSPKM